MAEELDPQTPEGEEPERPETSPVLDRLRQRYGLTPEMAGEEPAEEKPKREAPAPKQEASPPKQGFRKRENLRNEFKELQRQHADLMEAHRQTLALLPKPAAKPGADPEQDPRGYTKEVLQEAIAEAFGGKETLEWLRRTRETSEQQAQAFKERLEDERIVGDWVRDLHSQEADYFAEEPEREQPYRQAMEDFMVASIKYYVDDGYHPDAAYWKALSGLINIAARAEERGENVAAYLDKKWKLIPPHTERTNGHDPKKKQREENRETTERRKASAAASSLSSTKAPPAASVTAGIHAAREDRPGSAAAIARAAKLAGSKSGLDPRQVLRRAEREES